MILLFNMHSHPALSGYQAIAALSRCPLYHIAQEDYNKPLGSLVFSGLPPVSGAPSEPVVPVGTILPDSFSDPMVVFAGMSNQEVNTFLDRLKAMNVPSVPLKAVMTPTTQSWTALELHSHLKEEHAAYQQYLKGKRS